MTQVLNLGVTHKALPLAEELSVAQDIQGKSFSTQHNAITSA